MATMNPPLPLLIRRALFAALALLCTAGLAPFASANLCTSLSSSAPFESFPYNTAHSDYFAINWDDYGAAHTTIADVASCQAYCTSQANLTKPFYFFMFLDACATDISTVGNCVCFPIPCTSNHIKSDSFEGFGCTFHYGKFGGFDGSTAPAPPPSPPSPPRPPSPPPKSKVSGDPHFVGAHGTHFDFNGYLGMPYCLITDERLHMNALLEGYKSEATVGASLGADGAATRSWMRELGVMWKDERGGTHALHLVARRGRVGASASPSSVASLKYDGMPLALPEKPGAVLVTPGVTLSFLGTVHRRMHAVEVYSLSIPGLLEVSIEVRPSAQQFQLPQDSQMHFDLSINAMEASPKVHGVLGQTFRHSSSQMLKAVKYSMLASLLGEPVKADGVSGKGFLDGDVTSYVASNVLTPDCKVTAFAV